MQRVGALAAAVLGESGAGCFFITEAVAEGRERIACNVSSKSRQVESIAARRAAHSPL